jgi:hypothetical protein
MSGKMHTPTRRSLLSLMLGGATLLSAEQISGGWSANVAGRTLGGAWTAQPHEQQDTAWGTWSLLDRSGRKLASGTWSARKVAGQWEGGWQAEVDGRGSYSGSWAADAGVDGSAPMFKLFQTAADDVVHGTFRTSSRISGSWAIRAEKR